MKSKRSAFTLVELLVVIGIIGLLISILLPTLNRAREAGRRVKCLSNLRQVGIAFLNYNYDFKMFPTRTWMSQFYGTWTAEFIAPSYPAYFLNNDPGPITIDSFIYNGPSPVPESAKKSWSRKYFQDYSVLQCPSDKRDSHVVFNQYGAKQNHEIWGTSYFYNCRDNFAYNSYPNSDSIPGSLMKRGIGKIANASRVIVLGDPAVFTYAGDSDSPRRWRWHERNTEYGNALFADFHAEGIEASKSNPNYLEGPNWTFLAGKPYAAIPGY